MRQNVSIWISGLIFLLLILLGPIWAFPSLQKQLNNETATLSSFQSLLADGAILEWHGRNGYLKVPEGYDSTAAEAVADEIDQLTGVRDIAVIYDSSIPMPAPTESEKTTETVETEAATETTTEEAVETRTEPEVTVDEVAEVEEAVEAILEFSSIEFESGTANLTASSQSTITEIASALKANEAVKLVVVGHTDSQGDDEMNMQLSLERATSVVTALVTEGVSANQLTSEGKGETEPIASNDTLDGRKLNRRVEFIGLEN